MSRLVSCELFRVLQRTFALCTSSFTLRLLRTAAIIAPKRLIEGKSTSRWTSGFSSFLTTRSFSAEEKGSNIRWKFVNQTRTSRSSVMFLARARS